MMVPPYANLGIEYYPTIPAKPGQIAVMVDGKIIALVELEEFKRCAARLAEMEADRARGDGKAG